MKERSVFTLAALASAAMPNLALAGTRESGQYPLGADGDIDVAVVTDTGGREYDVSVSDTVRGKQRLRDRANAAAALLRAKDPAGLGFALERAVAYQAGEHDKAPTGSNAVLITLHNDGMATPLSRLTESQCVSAGTAIGALHRLRPSFMEKEGYPIFSATQIRQQLERWIDSLKSAGHIPTEITSSWERVIGTEGLWSFRTCLVHGGFSDGDMLFSSTGLNAIYNWANMQVNDPARDLAWIFDKLDAHRRNSVLSAYARMIGSRLDDLIVLRASLWLQMEQVGDFIRALDRADNERIMVFKAQVERLAHRLTVRESRLSAESAAGRTKGNPSTISVESLLTDDERRGRRRSAARTDGRGTDDRTGDWYTRRRRAYGEEHASERPAPSKTFGQQGDRPTMNLRGGDSDGVGEQTVPGSFAPESTDLKRPVLTDSMTQALDHQDEPQPDDAPTVAMPRQDHGDSDEPLESTGGVPDGRPETKE